MNTKYFPQLEGLTIDPNWITSDKGMKGYLDSVPLMAQIICHDLHFARNTADMLYFYKDGKYQPKGENTIIEAYNYILDYMQETNSWDKVIETKLVGYIASRAPYLLDRPDLYRINLRNGIYSWADGSFTPHDPAYYTTTQLPIEYDPEAICPTWHRFLEEILPGGKQFLLELIGVWTIPFTGNQKCIILFGPGGNGKSLFLSSASKLIGAQNISNIPLHVLTDKHDRFGKAGLMGKLLNIFADLSTRDIDDPQGIKTLTGEDRIQIEFKGKQPFDYEPYARMIFSSNRKIVAKETDGPDEGWLRRVVHVPFMQTFNTTLEESRQLKDDLENELPGLFNAIVPLIANVVDNGFTITAEILEIIEMYTPINKTTKEWLQATIRVDPNGAIPSNGLYNMYMTHCPVTESVSSQKLNIYLKSLFPSVQINRSIRFGPEKKVTNCYRGITLATPELWDNLINQYGFKYGYKQESLM